MIEKELLNSEMKKFLSTMHADLATGLLYAHTRINDNTKKTLESTSFLYALIDLLNDKGLITIAELDERKRQVAERLVQKFTESGLGLMYQDPEYDKYTFEHEAQVECQSRLHVCQAICCKLPFALSRQDVEEGILRWEFGRPYLIAHDGDGYCVHLDRQTYQCTAYNHRPVPCRGFDCRNSERWRIWQDDEQNTINSELHKQLAESHAKLYLSSERKT